MQKEKKQPVAVEAGPFQQALDGVIPLAPVNRIVHSPPPRRATIHNMDAAPQPIADTLSDHGCGAEILTEFMRSGISRMSLRKLRRGHWPVQDSLDLHGLSSEAARKLLLGFLHHATQQGLRCVCVIHGKGLHTNNGEGILKARVRHWLTQCAEVLAFCEPAPNEGGGGAVKVLLKASAGNRP